MTTNHTLAVPAAFRLAPLARLAACAAAALACVLSAARADEYIDKANAPFKQIAADKRSDTVLLPLLAKMTDPPTTVARPSAAAMMPSTSPNFAAAVEWAKAETQAEVIAGLRKVTTDDPKADWRKQFGFGQPYGAQDVDPDMFAIKMYTDLGDGEPTLSRARILYMPALQKMECLVHIEVTRLANEGKPGDAIDLLVRWVQFGRQMVDRRFYEEQKWAFEAMLLGLERMRDVAFLTTRPGPTTLTADQMKNVVRRLKDKNSLMGLDRLKLPEAEKLASLQVVSRIFLPGGGPGPAFASTLASLGAKKRPLRLFTEIAKWDAVAAAHEGERLSRMQAENVYNDWATRWELSPWDIKLKLASDYKRLDKVKFAALDALLGDISELFELRRRLEVELGGTRMSLAHVGLFAATKNLAPDFASIRPRIVDPRDGDAIDLDPFSTAKLPYLYLIPVRDTTLRGADKKPYAIRVFVPGEKDPFEKLFQEDLFVLYSRGPDLNDTRCARATQMVTDERGDYLIWPPVLSLYREKLAADQKLP
ncbi:MAG: hypothetical protein ACT4PL_03285 [Phycisphaerales bacterium]